MYLQWKHDEFSRNFVLPSSGVICYTHTALLKCNETADFCSSYMKHTFMCSHFFPLKMNFYSQWIHLRHTDFSRESLFLCLLSSAANGNVSKEHAYMHFGIPLVFLLNSVIWTDSVLKSRLLRKHTFASPKKNAAGFSV